MSTDPWQLLPELTEDEYAALKADIAANGVRLAVVVDADTGAIIDGHHRLRAWTELRAKGAKLPDYPRDVRRFSSDEERVGFVLAANLFRRHLTREQRAEIVARLRSEGWSVRQIAGATGTSVGTVHSDLAAVQNRTPASNDAETVLGADGKFYPAHRPKPTPSIVVGSAREESRARAALSTLGDAAPPKMLGLLRAEERARDAAMAELRSIEVPLQIEGPAYELRLGDLREVWADIPEYSIDAIVTDPPYDDNGIPLYEDLARLALRILKPGRLAAVYCGHVHLDEEMALLAEGGLTYVWHGVNILPGRHTKIHTKMINGRHRSVLLFSAGPFEPRRWIHDAYFAQGVGGPETRPLHPWQQAIEPTRHWVRMTSEPGELVFDPFIGSGTTAVAAVSDGRRFLGGDLDSACVETTRLRLVELQSELQGDEFA